MNIKITFRNIESSPVMEQYIQKNLEKVTRLLKREPSPINIEVTVDAEFVHHNNRVDILLKSPHYDLFVDHKGPDVYPLIDKVVETMAAEIIKNKDKRIDLRKKGESLKGVEEFLPSEEEEE